MNIVIWKAWTVVMKAGVFIWPLMAISVLGAALALEKLSSLAAARKALERSAIRILELIKQGRLEEASRLCQEDGNAAGEILGAGISASTSDLKILNRVMDHAAENAIAPFQARIGLLAWLVNLAPLMGVLGALTGLCVVFHAVQVRSNALNPAGAGDLAAGIWQSLLTSVAGLSVGIVLLTFKALAVSRFNAFLTRIRSLIDRAADDLHHFHASQGES